MADRLTARLLVACLTAASAAAPATAQGPGRPIIDMHLHVSRVRGPAPIPICTGAKLVDQPVVDPREPERDLAPPCPSPILSAKTTAELQNGLIAELKRLNVRRAVLAARNPAELAGWLSAAPGRFIPAAAPRSASSSDFDALAANLANGTIAIFAELGPQYQGVRADDPRLEPFWALAEAKDAPVGIHLGEGNPGVQQNGSQPERYRAALTSPFQLEAVLLKHPRLRLYVMHAASPLTDEMIAMLFEYPQLYVDVAANVWNMPRAQFYAQLKRLTDAGFTKRIMFGSDPGIWPQAVGLAIDTIEQAPFLTAGQKRDILYNNAARFLRLTPEQIAADHR